MFGVMTLARERSSSISADTASSPIRRAPLVATMTGSTTMFSACHLSRLAAITRMISADDTMPIFTASGRMSEKTASICSETNAAGTSCTPVTPSVFCAVSAVMTVSANR